MTVSDIFLQSKENICKEYKQGYSFGIAPAFVKYENLDHCGKNFQSVAFKNGFIDGRKLFMHLNGSCEIPSVILTIRDLYNNYSDGTMNRNCEIDNRLTNYQIALVKFYHNLGKRENYSSLFSVLNNLQIEILK